MKQFLRASSTILVLLTVLLANPGIVLASEGDGGHGLEATINGYHVTLASQNEWAKGENTIMVTLTDEVGMPISGGAVEILIAPSSDGHAEPEADAHGAESEHNSMPGVEVDGHEPAEPAGHEEENTEPIAMRESHKPGSYIAETHLESSGEYEVRVFFHVNGEMLEADFVVESRGTTSRTAVLWSFAVVNVGLVSLAAILRRQPVSWKGKQ